MLEVRTDGASQNDRLEVASFAREFGHRVTVRHPCDFLVEDRALVEILGDVVRSGPDQLHTAIVGLTIRIGADEGGQERVVDVDDSRSIGVDQDGGQNLHVARQNDEVDVEGSQRFQHLCFLGRLGVG